ALARSGLDDQLSEMLRRIMPVFDAHAALVLIPSLPAAGTFAVRAAVGIDQMLRAPVRVRGGDAERALVGLLYLASEHGHSFTSDELGLLRLIAERVAGAIDRASLLEAERSARGAAEAAEGRMRLLLEAGETLSAETAVQRRLEQITRLAVPKLADFCA